MKKQVPVSVLLLAVFAAVLLTFQCTYVGLTVTYSEKMGQAEIASSDLVKLDSIRQIFEQNYLYSEDLENIDYDVFLSGEAIFHAYVLATGDPYAAYYSAEDWMEQAYSSAGNLVGIGVSVVYSEANNTIEVLFAMDGSPAKEAGILPGDFIVGVDSVRVEDVGYENAVNRVRGEIGTRVTVTVLREHDDGTSEEIDLTMTRREVVNQSVLYYVTEADDSIGVIRILEFDDRTPEQFENALAALEAEGVTKLIFDVRGNPGGDRDSVASVLDPLLPEGVIATFVTVDGTVDYSVDSDAECLDMPMVVLADGNTASAGELFTCALMDYEVATFIGTETYGKGVAQGYRQLSDGSVIKLTTHFYNPPKSENYDGYGIEPDIEVELPEEYQGVHILTVPQSEDTQLAAAIAELNK